MIIKTEEIIFRGADTAFLSRKAKTVCDIFSYQPENIEQTPLGNLYIVTQLSNVKDSGHLNNLLASIIKREYYLSPRKGQFNSLQSALKKSNQHLADLASRGNLEWLGKIHFICASITEKNIFLTQVGDSKAYLFRENHLVNLSHKIIPGSEKPHPSKVFSSVVSGKIETEDKIILATPAINDLFTQSGLRQILINQSNLPNISDQMNRVLREQQKPIPLAILLLKAEADEVILKTNSSTKQIAKTITPPIDLKEIIK